MNRNQRKIGRIHQKQIEDVRSVNVKDQKEFTEVLPPKHRRAQQNVGQFPTNKCCYTTPSQIDFGQMTDEDDDMYPNIHVPDTIGHLRELRRLFCNSVPKMDHSIQCTACKESTAGPTDPGGSTWQNIDRADDIDKYIGSIDSDLCSPNTVSISDTPHIKIIANKFSRFKKNNIELRKLEEKVVCLEYDVYLGNGGHPVEKLRAFFSIKPNQVYEDSGKEIPRVESIPSTIKNRFNIASDDLRHLNEKEIEIIDGQIEENKTYLDDLKRILKRQQVINSRRKKCSLDLITLYEMAKRHSPALDRQYSNTNILSKAELQEIKELIVKKCASSVHGINRRTVGKDTSLKNQSSGVISQSIVAELWREGSTVCN